MTDYEWAVPENAQEILTPALLYDKDRIEENIRRTIKLAGGADRLWVHVKSHKTKEIVAMSRGMGITHFKASTIAEAAMLADCKAEHILLAYPLAGPSRKAYCRIAGRHPELDFCALGDDIGQLDLLYRQCEQDKVKLSFLIDVDPGQHRTGVRIDGLSEFVKRLMEETGVRPVGIHCYDGHLGISDRNERQNAVDRYREELEEQLKLLSLSGYELPIRIMGGSPTMPCHLKDGREGLFVSPGTTFLWDAGYGERYPDMEFLPAAAVLTRVVSGTGEGRFTLDLGYKAIASDPAGCRGRIAGLPHASELFQNEEHWVFQMEEGREEECPPVGSLLCVIPVHICPTSALYNGVWVVQEGKIRTKWEIAARDRQLQDSR